MENAEIETGQGKRGILNLRLEVTPILYCPLHFWTDSQFRLLADNS
ncbi:hypothetical protein M595_1907 [Lyngbya aestuarii BL J]|uniref:Uncharacterized protein n=1 Tax=Lyngbya aestuarii BL J TaxID=1348334 RepID=U7QNU8_9CYAN|nr:hypothetical protein M595_1907 [Lyngbya aestuarii BL J]